MSVMIMNIYDKEKVYFPNLLERFEGALQNRTIAKWQGVSERLGFIIWLPLRFKEFLQNWILELGVVPLSLEFSMRNGQKNDLDVSHLQKKLLEVLKHNRKIQMTNQQSDHLDNFPYRIYKRGLLKSWRTLCDGNKKEMKKN